MNDQGKPITVTGIKLMANPLPSLTEQQLQQQQAANNRLDSNSTETDSLPQEDEAMSPTQHEVEEIAADLQTLPEKESQPSSTTAQPPQSAPAADHSSKPKRSRPRIRELRVNLGDLTAAAARLGIDAPGRNYQSLLDRVLQAAAPTPASPAPSELLAPLLEELAAIKQQMNASQAGEELEQLRQQTEQQQQEIDRQQQEIDRLTAELQAATSRLHQIAAKAQELAGIQTSPTPTPNSQSAPTKPPAAPMQQQFGNPPIAQPPAPPQRFAAGRPPAGKLSPADRVPIAITALIQHNLNSHPTDRWFLSGNVIATAAGANPALVVTPWLQAHPIAMTQIEQHNAAIGLNSRSNGKDKDRGQLKRIYQQFTEGKAIEELQHIINQFETQPA